jgi:hypothetical protein
VARHTRVGYIQQVKARRASIPVTTVEP